MRIIFGRKLVLAYSWQIFRNTAASANAVPPFKADTAPFFGFNMSQTINQLSDIYLPEIDPLTVTTFDLQELLAKNIVSSVQFVHLYLNQIEKHNRKGARVGAIISTAPREQVLEIATNLDLERERTGPCGPLHGIPVIVKDVFNTPTLGMATTSGSLALKDLKATSNTGAMDLLLKAGMIIIGKTNLSELEAYKAYKISAGWSAAGKQTQSPYVRGGITHDALPLGHSTPASSSSGVGAGVASGFAPLGVGTESDGSLVQPATRAALYRMKGALNTINTTRTMGLPLIFDSIGAVGKSTRDMATLLGILQGGIDQDHLGGRAEVKTAVGRVSRHGAKVVQPVRFINVSGVFESGVEGVNDVTDIMNRDFRKTLEDYLAFFHNPNMKTLEDVIQFNSDHTDEKLPDFAPDQLSLIDAQDCKMADDIYEAGVKHMQEMSRSSIIKTLYDNDIDVIIGPADARIASVAACAGYLVATVPLGFADFNGRAFGMNLISTAGNEAKMIEVMSAWESTFPNARVPPPILVDWANETQSLSAHI